MINRHLFFKLFLQCSHRNQDKKTQLNLNVFSDSVINKNAKGLKLLPIIIINYLQRIKFISFYAYISNS